jgi:phosphatidylglycerophosphatase A
MVLATGFGIGLLPGPAGTWGSLAALPGAALVAWLWGSIGLAVAAALVFALGCWAAGAAARSSGILDPGFIVIDEVAGQFVALLPAPLDPLGFAAGFALFRLFDITKPFPAGWADRRIHGGFGIMLDDIAAGGYAALVMIVLARCGVRF